MIEEFAEGRTLNARPSHWRGEPLASRPGTAVSCYDEVLEKRHG